MRHILLLLYFGIAWQNIFANALPHQDAEKEKPFFYLLDSDADKNNFTLRLKSLEKKVGTMANTLELVSSRLENLIESEETRKTNQAFQDPTSELDLLSQPQELPNIFQMIGDKFYYIERKEKRNWFDARDKCISMNSNLVDQKNEDEWRAITSHLDLYESYWVDLKESESEGNFPSGIASKESPIIMWFFKNPKKLATSMDNEPCVKLRSEIFYYLNAPPFKTHCSEKNYFVCEDKNPFNF